MLAVDQPVDAVRGLATGEQKRVAARPHQRIGTEHRLELQRALAERPLGHAHQHARGEGLVVAPPAALAIVDEVEHPVGHQRPVAGLFHQARVFGRVGLPCCPRTLALHRVRPEGASHLHPCVTRMVHLHSRHRVGPGRHCHCTRLGMIHRHSHLRRGGGSLRRLSTPMLRRHGHTRHGVVLLRGRGRLLRRRLPCRRTDGFLLRCRPFRRGFFGSGSLLRRHRHGHARHILVLGKSGLRHDDGERGGASKQVFHYKAFSVSGRAVGPAPQPWRAGPADRRR